MVLGQRTGVWAGVWAAAAVALAACAPSDGAERATGSGGDGATERRARSTPPPDAAGSRSAPRLGRLQARACGVDAGTKCALGDACREDQDCASGTCGALGAFGGRCVSARSCTGARGADGHCGGEHDCCGSIRVPGGAFVLRDGAGGARAEVVAPFRLDRFEITVGRLRAFFDAKGGDVRSEPPREGEGEHPLVGGSGWRAAWNALLPGSFAEIDARMTRACDDNGGSGSSGSGSSGSGQVSDATTWMRGPGPDDDKPANCIDWYTLFAFCAWDGGRLPTDAEWSYVAYGGAEERAFPWGDDAPVFETHAHVVATSLVAPGSGFGRYTEGAPFWTAGDGASHIAPVGKKSGRSRWGHADMGGNVTELVLDSPREHVAPCAGCEAGDERLARGGSWRGELAGHALANDASRRSVRARAASSAVGARCARGVP